VKVSFQGISDISAKTYCKKNGYLICAETKFKLDNKGQNHLDLFRDEYEEVTGYKFVGNEVNLRVTSSNDFYVNNRRIRKNPATKSFFTKTAELLNEIRKDAPFSSFTNIPPRAGYLEKPTYDFATNIFKKLNYLDIIDIVQEKSMLAVIESITKKVKNKTKIKLKY
jgi:hypothetical protein